MNGMNARVCCRFVASRVAARNGARLGVGRRQWLFPCQVLQRQLAPFPAQPFGPGLFLREARHEERSLVIPNERRITPHRVKTGAGAAADEMATDPRTIRAHRANQASLRKSGGIGKLPSGSGRLPLPAWYWRS